MRPDPLPAQATTACPRPEALLVGNDWRLIAGRLGDALLDCEARRALAVAGYDRVRQVLGTR